MIIKRSKEITASSYITVLRSRVFGPHGDGFAMGHECLRQCPRIHMYTSSRHGKESTKASKRGPNHQSAIHPNAYKHYHTDAIQDLLFSTVTLISCTHTCLQTNFLN